MLFHTSLQHRSSMRVDLGSVYISYLLTKLTKPLLPTELPELTELPRSRATAYAVP